MKVYDFTVKDINGKDVSLSEYRGKALLIVNTATESDFSPQYRELQKLYERYWDRGFEVLDFPCNQFSNKESITDEEIVKICIKRYGVTFKIFSNIKVNGKKESPLYKWLKSERTGIAGPSIKWDFTKFLINKDGDVVARYAPITSPFDFEKEIQMLL